MPPEVDNVSPEDLEAAADMYDRLVAGTLYADQEPRLNPVQPVFAINVADLSQEPILAMVYGDVLNTGRTVNTEPGAIDGWGVVLDCDFDRAQAIVDAIRISKTKSQLRCYRKDGGKPWRRI